MKQPMSIVDTPYKLWKASVPNATRYADQDVRVDAYAEIPNAARLSKKFKRHPLCKP